MTKYRSLNDYVSLLIANSVLKDPAIEGVIEWCSPHDHRGDLSHEPIIVPVGEISRLNGGYDAVSDIA